MGKWVKSHLYCLALLYFVFFIIGFVLLEHYSTPKYMIRCFLDDRIPFCEFFVLPYFLWFPLMAVSLGYFMFQSKEDFQNLCFLMFQGMTISLISYVIWPNGLCLRQPIVRDNICCKIVSWLYQIDAPTNVCPSIHVASTTAIDLVIHQSEKLKLHKGIRLGSRILALCICLGTLFIKQHSLIDVLAGFLLTGILGVITYHVNWRMPLAHTKLKILL